MLKCNGKDSYTYERFKFKSSDMNKKSVITQIIATLQQSLEATVKAANQAHQTATHKESVAKTKYDTFGLEASYLAHGQFKRVIELEEAVESFKNMPIIEFDDTTEIAVTALVFLESEDGDLRTIFIGPSGGGLKVECGSVEVIVITAGAPLGRKLLGKGVGDEVSFSVDNQVKSFEIVKLL